MSTTLKILGIKTVTTAGTIVPVFSAPYPRVTTVVIRALSGNSGVIYVGDTAVSASGDLGLKLQAGFDIIISGDEGGLVAIDSLRLDSTANNNSVSVSYLELS